VEEAARTVGGKGTIATSCPFCLTMIKDGIGETGRSEQMEARDIAELVAQSLP
jgi:Fe-S oxidoreductase